jgi:hypothetical protein
MDIWGWILARRKEYVAVGDEDRIHLTTAWTRAFPFRESNPDEAVAILSEACVLADQLGESWWSLLLHYWRLMAVMQFKRDFRQAVELGVRDAVLASKPENLAFPGRHGIYSNLLDAYLGVDPVGYAEPIRETIAFLDRDVAVGADEDRYQLLASVRQFNIYLGNLDVAHDAALETMRLIDDDPDAHQGYHYTTFNASHLCWIAHHRRDWPALADAAEMGETAARTVGHQMELCEFLAWQAVLARRDGDELRARRLFTTAASRLARLRMPPESGYPEAIAYFHELAGDLDRALQTRDQELAAVRGTGRFAYECDVHLKRAVLLAKLDRLTVSDLDAARAAARQLRKPEHALAEIETLSAVAKKEDS